MAILITGGAGYIGSHTCVELLDQGYDIITLDNFSNSKLEVIDKIKQITNKSFKTYKINLLDKDELSKIFKENNIESVIHFAGFKAVEESVKKPLMYYKNNINGTINLLEVMNENRVKNIVFSSSATVYGDPEELPIKEDFSLSVTNPYGRTKLMIEEILSDVYISDNKWNILILRYFNPVGAHGSGLIGEESKGVPNNLMPYIVQVASGEREYLNIFGDDYPTHDGTGVRDYIHVVDLARGHIKALDRLKLKKGIDIYNLGTGKGYSVFEMVQAFEKVNDVKIPYKITDRRLGDIAECYADPEKAYKELSWKAENGIEEMCRSAWKAEKRGLKYENPTYN